MNTGETVNRNRSTRPWMDLRDIARAAASVPFAGFVLFLFAAGFPPFDDETAVNLTIHMAQHVLIVVGGIMAAYPLYRKGLFGRPSPALKGLGFAVVAAALVYWHLPAAWDASVLNPWIHAAEHASFFLAGLLIGSVLAALSGASKIGLLIVAFFTHMSYAVVLTAPWNSVVYPLYPLGQQQVLGYVLLLTGPGLLVAAAYVLNANRQWLQGFSDGVPEVRGRKLPGKQSPFRFVAPVLSAAMIATTAVYFGAVAAAIVTAPPPQGARGAAVYIEETPVTWQYSPQNITVVLGVNSTVTWISHSVSYDTVTADDGSFASGVIPPGGSFTHDFTAPGTYGYHCIYHPWMVGTVTVLPPA